MSALSSLGDSILGAVVAERGVPYLSTKIDEGGLTRIKVALVSGASALRCRPRSLGFADIIVFGSSETRHGHVADLHSALENVYEAVVAALYLDAGIEGCTAHSSNARLFTTHEHRYGASEPENPKSALQEKLQEEGITPTY